MTGKIDYINPPGTGPAQGLYSHVARVPAGTLLFLAGQLSVGRDGAVVGKGDFERQFHQTFENLGAVLSGMGVGWAEVVKFTTYLVRSQDIETFMRARAALFPRLFPDGRHPPNTLLVVDGLVKEEFLLEVEAVARAKD
ncbi:MAG TPA: RidA family protein [Stellaceae bacterium]|nr:RidA family protein [Stellaceae bacterium]